MDTKWNGWGATGKRFPLTQKAGFLAYLDEMLGPARGEYPPCPSMEQVKLPEPASVAPLAKTAVGLLGEAAVREDRRARLTHACGRSYRDLIQLRNGSLPNAPDLVLFPTTEKQVEDILHLASSEGVSVIPFGGGSSVVGGVDPLRKNPETPCVSLDLRGLNRVLSLHKESQIAEVQPGIYGPDLESWLGARGLTLGHTPQSFEFSTLGGWIAANSSGQQSTRYGRIADLVVNLQVATPTGTFTRMPVPASAAGPDISQIFVGSEGILGVITRAHVRLRPAPRARAVQALYFRHFENGLKALREMIQAGLAPAVARLSDEDETEAALHLADPPSGKLESIRWHGGRWYLSQRGYARGSVLILMFEGTRAEVEREENAVMEIGQSNGGFKIGRGPARNWYRDRYEHPYLRDELLDRGFLVDTLETATSWHNLSSLHREIKAALTAALESTGTKALVYAHVSHLYPDGASLYYTIIGRRDLADPLGQWQIAKRAASEAVIQNGGTISHHHGVGIDHLPWLASEVGEVSLRALRALKRELDPAGIMNPGKVLP